MQFLDVKTDYAFKKVFGSEGSKNILKSFLNSIIEFKNHQKIEDLEIVDPYNIPLLKGMKDTFVDVKARLEDQTIVIIEMQVLNHDGFEKRVLYNMTKNYSQQLQKSENYSLLNPVIALTIVNFEMFDYEKYKSNYILLEKEDFIEYSGDVELIFIELPKFKKSLEECKDIEDKWLYFIKNSEDLSVIPKDCENEIKDAYKIANTANFTLDELELQRKRKEFIYIQKSSITKAKREGLEQGIKQGIEQGVKQGIEQGIEQGEKKAKMDIVKTSLKRGVDIETIALITGFTIEDIKLIKDKH
jgi:predicted transposase/invertase (TIGR01784 family)